MLTNMAVLAAGSQGWAWLRPFRAWSLRQFRQWATARVEEYLVKGFTLDELRKVSRWRLRRGGTGLNDSEAARKSVASESRSGHRLLVVGISAGGAAELQQRVRAGFAREGRKPSRRPWLRSLKLIVLATGSPPPCRNFSDGSRSTTASTPAHY